MLNIEQELEKYKVSKSFIEDCESLKSEFIIKKAICQTTWKLKKQLWRKKLKPF